MNIRKMILATVMIGLATVSALVAQDLRHRATQKNDKLVQERN